MPKDHFIAVLRKEYAALTPLDRKKKVRELVAESRDNEKFIREEFPEFFAEAFPSSNDSNRAGRRSVSSARVALVAKRR